MGMEMQKWADPAMFKSEPLKASEGPKVYLLSMTPDPLGSIAAACKMYKGEVVRSLDSITDSERRDYFAQVQKTKLQAPFEFVDFHFMIEGVTRSFTHQMVRQRMAVYAQESLRFAVKEDLAEGVALPPSLAGTTQEYLRMEEELREDEARCGGGWPPEFRANRKLAAFARLSEAEQQRAKWDRLHEHTQRVYRELVESGMPAEDARGLLPHNITTRLHYKTNLRSLLDHAGNRLCTQAQFEWRAVFAKIIEAIRSPSFGPDHGWTEGRPHLRDEANGQSMVWMSRELATIFKPVCYQTGKCEFKADFDRKCKIRNRVDANHDIGRPSDAWGQEHDAIEDNPIMSGVGPKSVVRDKDKRPVFIGAISPVEWIADPGAAR